MPDHHRRSVVHLRRLVAATAVSSLGDGLALVAFSLLALHLTNHAILVAGVAVASRLPWLLVALPAGALVDRVERRRLVVAVDLLRAVLAAATALGIASGHFDLAELYAVVFLLGAGETVVSAASRAVVPLLVGGEELPGANGKLSAARTFGMRFAGPALGGFVYSATASLPLVGDALSYLLSAVLLRSAIPVTLEPVRSSAAQVRADVVSGLRWFLANPPLRVLAVVVSSFAFFQAMVLAVLVLYSAHVLHLGEAGYGLFLGIAAVGDVLASLLAGGVHDRLGPYATILVAGLVAGGGYLLLGATSRIGVAFGALALEAAATSIGNVATLSVRHRIIPTARFGVVSNAFRMSIAALAPLGALAGGGLTAAMGTRTTFLAAGVGQLVLLGVMALPLRSAAIAQVPTPVPPEAR